MSKLFVYGINQNCDKDTIEKEFQQCGAVEDVYNTGKGYAFVTMADPEGAEKAKAELNGYMIDGQEIKVDDAKPRQDGGGQRRGGYRSFDGGDRRGGYGGGRGRGGYGGGRGGGYGGGRGGFGGGDRDGGFGGGRSRDYDDDGQNGGHY